MQRPRYNGGGAVTRVTRSISQRGSEFLANIVYKPAKVGVLYQWRVCPNNFPRLVKFCETFQKWKVGPRGISVKVSSTTHPLSSGSFYGGFITDVSDTPNSYDEILTQLRASNGAEQFMYAKIASTTGQLGSHRFRMPRQGAKTFYTSQGDDMRLTSPGTFWLIADTPSDVAPQLTLSVEFDFQFMSPTLQDIVPFGTVKQLYAADGDKQIKIDITKAISEEAAVVSAFGGLLENEVGYVQLGDEAIWNYEDAEEKRVAKPFTYIKWTRVTTGDLDNPVVQISLEPCYTVTEGTGAATRLRLEPFDKPYVCGLGDIDQIVSKRTPWSFVSSNGYLTDGPMSK